MSDRDFNQIRPAPEGPPLLWPDGEAMVWPRRGGIPVGRSSRDIPITDAAHVRLAVSQWRYYVFPSLAVKREAARRVLAAAERFGVDVAPELLEEFGEIADEARAELSLESEESVDA